MSDAGDSAPLPELRVGDADRQAALRALDTHLEDGRLSIEEYGDRSAAAVVAVVRSELADLFADLPAPHPPLPVRPGATPVASPAAVPAPRRHDEVDRDAGPGPGLALATLMMLLVMLPAVATLGVAAGPALGGLLFLPLLFLVLGVAGRSPRRRDDDRGHR